MHDPREVPVLPTRDYAGLAFVGCGFEVAQYQLRAAIFPGLSEVVASRRVRRWEKLKLIQIERWMGMGMNLIRLTPAGRDRVVEAGVATEDDLFTPSKAVATKDVQHQLAVNDVRTLALQGVPFAADTVSASWQLQRRFQPPPAAIPDVLLTKRAKDGKRGRLLAVEVDLGAERLVGVFLPKLKLLVEVLEQWAEGGSIGIVVLTRGPRRILAMRAGIEELDLPVSVLVEALPTAVGAAALICLRTVLSGPGQVRETSTQTEPV